METTALYQIAEAEYRQIKEVVKMCIDQENFITAQEAKVRINYIQHRLLQSEMDKATILLYVKFRDQERKIDMFIIKQLKDEFNNLEPTNVMMLIQEWPDLPKNLQWVEWDTLKRKYVNSSSVYTFR